MPSISQIEYALAVEKYRHFGRAAEACHISQPTLSQQLQKLEDEVGIIVFDRMQKPILPTAEGQSFLDQARVVWREHEKLVHLSKKGKKGEPSGDFRLAIIPTVASYLIPLFALSFSKKYPHVNLHIEEMKTETIIEELRNDRIEGAILATPLPGLTFKVHPLYYEPFFLYLCNQHPLLAKKQLLPSDLEGSQMWQLQDGHCFRDQVIGFCSLSRAENSALPNIDFRSGSLDTLVRLVEKNKGYTMIPALMAETMGKKEKENHLRPFRAPTPTREISFIYRRDHWKLEIISAIESAIRGSLPEAVSLEKTKDQKVLDII
jgi:LysR family transcriptional regulator, hydrogen peroxide-inducible genes activator